MARISQGNALTTAMLQPGAKFQTDGYGLVTGTLVFKEDAAGSSAFLARGQACPIAAFNFCTVHKANTSIDALGLNTYTVDYVGISLADAGSSTITKPQITGSQGLTTEHITAHPNFFTLDSAAGFTGTAIAGVGTGTTTTPIYTSTGTGEYRGNNGSTFAASTGEAFRGFKLPLYGGLYGKTNYLAAQTSFSGHFYTTATGNVTGLRDRVGKTSGTNQFNGIKLVPDYVGTVFTVGTPPNDLNQLLLAQISFEDYGNLYKVTYEVRFNRVGYHKSVYADA